MTYYNIGVRCGDCVEGVCTMNCSCAVLATGSEWIATSIAAKVFPEKATAEQVRRFRGVYRCAHGEPIKHCADCVRDHQDATR